MCFLKALQQPYKASQKMKGSRPISLFLRIIIESIFVKALKTQREYDTLILLYEYHRALCVVVTALSVCGDSDRAFFY